MKSKGEKEREKQTDIHLHALVRPTQKISSSDIINEDTEELSIFKGAIDLVSRKSLRKMSKCYK